MPSAPETLRADIPSEPATARRRTGLWPLLTRLHFYAGVFVAPFVLVAALTGLLYTIAPQLDRALYGEELFADDPGAQSVLLTDQVAAARAEHPEGTIVAVAPALDGRTTRVVLSVPEELGEWNQRTVYVDPATGEVRGALTTVFGSTPATTWLGGLHRNLHLGEFGRLYSELAASWLWVLALGGALLWLGRPGRYWGTRRPVRAVLPDRSARGVRATRGWHATLGLWMLVGLLVLSATGLTWSTYAGERFGSALDAFDARAPQLDTTLSASLAAGPTGAAAGAAPEAADATATAQGDGAPGGGADAEAVPAAEGGSHEDSGSHEGHGGSVGGAAVLPAGATVDEVVAAARAAGLDGPVEASPPAEESTAWTVAQVDDVWPVGRDQVAVDPATGEVTARNNWADYPPLAKLTTLGILAHMGVLFGLANQVLLAALAVGLLVTILWGYRMWWQRRPTRADRRRPLGSPPPRGTWRELHPAALVAVVVVTAAVAWALPVLGVTLVGFLVVDAVVGVVQRRRRPSVPPAEEREPQPVA